MHGMPMIGNIGLGREFVNGLSLVPSPPAKITVCVDSDILIRYVTTLLFTFVMNEWVSLKNNHATSFLLSFFKQSSTNVAYLPKFTSAV